MLHFRGSIFSTSSSRSTSGPVDRSYGTRFNFQSGIMMIYLSCGIDIRKMMSVQLLTIFLFNFLTKGPVVQCRIYIFVQYLMVKFSSYRINILDNIMKMMDRFAYNLEEVVEERTQQLLEEKKKTDRLLYRMLPP